MAEEREERVRLEEGLEDARRRWIRIRTSRHRLERGVLGDRSPRRRSPRSVRPSLALDELPPHDSKLTPFSLRSQAAACRTRGPLQGHYEEASHHQEAQERCRGSQNSRSRRPPWLESRNAHQVRWRRPRNRQHDPGTSSLALPAPADRNRAQDIVFVIEERPHDTFTREGDDLVLVVKVPLRDALSGPTPPDTFTRTIKSLDGRPVRFDLPYPSTKNGGSPLKPGQVIKVEGEVRASVSVRWTKADGWKHRGCRFRRRER
mgnify:CR=1 FL=1